MNPQSKIVDKMLYNCYYQRRVHKRTGKIATMASSREMIWRGRNHLGDEPGIFGNANYCGLAVELPFQIIPFDKTSSSSDVAVIITASEVNLIGGYPGHMVTISGFKLVSGTTPPVWDKTALANALITSSGDLSIPIGSLQSHEYLSATIQTDTSVAGGLYDDFIFEGLGIRSSTHYATFGFRFS